LPFSVPDDYERAGATKAFQAKLVSPSQINPTCDQGLDQIVDRCLALDRLKRYRCASELLSDLEGWTPKLQADTRESANRPRSTSKDVLGQASPPAPQQARSLAGRAIELAQNPATLNEAADLMEEAFNKLPLLRSEYQGRVKLWRRGISM